MVDYPLHKVCVGNEGMPDFYNMELVFAYIDEGQLVMLDAEEVIIVEN